MSNLNFTHDSILYVISGPSGSGKTTITKKIIEHFKDDPTFKYSVSITTRMPRDGEINGEDYIFTDVNTFSSMAVADMMLEYTEAYENFYGTPKEPIDTCISQGHDMVFDVENQGAAALLKHYPNNVVLIYVITSSIKIIEKRLIARYKNTHRHVELAYRLQGAVKEVNDIGIYEYLVINDDLSSALKSVLSIIEVENIKRKRIKNLPEVISKFLED